MQIFLSLMIVGIALCENTTTKTNTIQKGWELDIKKQYKLISEYFHIKDFTDMSNVYTDDCILMPPDIEPLTGRGALSIAASLIWRENAHTVTFFPQEIIANTKRIASERGVFVLKTADNSTINVDEYVAIWKRVQGQAKLYIHIWHSIPRQ